MKVSLDSDLENFVKDSLKEDQSPGGISGRLKYVRKDLRYASTKAIYKFVYSPNGRHVEQYLYSKEHSLKQAADKFARLRELNKVQSKILHPCHSELVSESPVPASFEILK